VLWVAGGLAEGDARAAIWVSALILEYLGPASRFWVPKMGRSLASDWTVEGSHLAERCGLFVIIALGETLLITGGTFSDLEWTPALITAMVAAFCTTVAMWWIYFDRTAEFASDLIAHSDDPGTIARLAYTYIHLPLIAGIIITAMGDEVVLAHPTDEAELSAALTVVGGPAMFLFGYILFKRAIAGRFYASPWVALGLLAPLFAAYPLLSPVALSVATACVLVAVALWARLVHPALVDSEVDEPASSSDAGDPALAARG
jgi:low temperature requirement protein LtrA